MKIKNTVNITMEAETISKHGRNPKSQMSRIDQAKIDLI